MKDVNFQSLWFGGLHLQAGPDLKGICLIGMGHVCIGYISNFLMSENLVMLEISVKYTHKVVLA